MITHADFAKLRLSDFVEEVVPLENWEYLGRVWIGEAVGFSEWLRSPEDPERLGSLAIEFESLDADSTKSILDALGLELAAGMQLEELRQVLGEPVGERRFVSDRITLLYEFGEPDAYDVSCTVLADGGLTYITMRPRTGAVA